MFESKLNVGASSFQQGMEHEKKKNYVDAERCYRVAADLGLADAQFALGRLYDEGAKGIEQNALEALKWYKRAAEQKHAEALFTLGYMYQFGQEVPKDEKKALAYYLEAAKLGHIEAQFHLGRLYQLSRSALQNNAEAIRWYALAVAQGHAGARINLETMANTGIKGAAAALDLLDKQALISQQPLKLSHLAQGLRYMTDPEQPDYRKAYEHIKIAVKEENRSAYVYFGLLHEYEKGPDKPLTEVALFFYAKADKNCVLMCLIEGICYLRDMKQTPSVLNAKNAAESFNRAIALLNEKGGEHLKIANFLERITEEKTQESADLILMMVYQMGLLGREKNLEKVVHFQQKVIEAGNVEVFYNLGELYARRDWPCKDVREAARWYLFAANKKHAKASFALGLLYRDGLLDGEKNYQEALKWFLLAADEGHYGLAHGAVAEMYAKGLGGLEPNEEEADRRYALGKIKADEPSSGAVQRISIKPPRTPARLTRMLSFFSSSSKKENVLTEGVQTVRVLHDWEAQLDHQLSITQGDTLYLLRELGDWLHCERRNHEDGMIPRNFVEFLPIIESPLTFPRDLPAIAVPILDKDIQYKRKLGQGGFGEVHKAYWNKMDVAVKSLLPFYDSEDNANIGVFKHELQVMLRLRHPNTVALCAYTTDTKTPHLVMEYMSEGALWDKLGARENKEKFLPWLVRYSLAINIANGLQYLHKKKILHRDLKSENVFLCYYAGNLFAKLGDFGLSHVSVEKGSIKTLFSVDSFGTPQWMAPELFDTLNKKFCYSKSTDKYAFAMILWELLTHKKPYDGLEQNEIFTRVLEGKLEVIPPDPQHEDFRTLIKRGWAQDAKERPPLPKFIELLTKGLQAEKIREEKGKEKEDGMQAAMADSSEIVKEEEIIGPREIDGFELEDVRDDGNCFYRAVASQLRITGRRNFLSGVPKETALHDSLRLLVQGKDFNDKEWADSEEIFKIMRQTRSIVAVIDTRHPHLGFRCYFSNARGNDEDTHQPLEASIDLPIIRLAFTGNHYLSVMTHSALGVGAIRGAFRTSNLSSSERTPSSSGSSTSLSTSRSSSDFFRIEPEFRNSGEGSKPATTQKKGV